MKYFQKLSYLKIVKNLIPLFLLLLLSIISANELTNSKKKHSKFIKKEYKLDF